MPNIRHAVTLDNVTLKVLTKTSHGFVDESDVNIFCGPI